MYEDRTQNYDPEIREEYLTQTSFKLTATINNLYKTAYRPGLKKTSILEKVFRFLGFLNF